MAKPIPMRRLPGVATRVQKHPAISPFLGIVLTLSVFCTREEENLEELSKLGHFLKGSSATLGLTKIKDSCEKIQRYGKKEKEDGSPLDDEKVCLEKITKTLKVVKEEYEEAETILNNFFKNGTASSTTTTTTTTTTTES
jgi:hypothetical protein